MENQTLLAHKIKELTSQVEYTNDTVNDIDTRKLISSLAASVDWSPKDISHVDFLSTRLDISKCLFLGYHSNGRKGCTTKLTDFLWLELVVAILLKSIYISYNKSDFDVCFKRFNSLYRALDLLFPKWLLPNTQLGKELELCWQALLNKLPGLAGPINITDFGKPVRSKDGKLREIPLIILFYEGPIARAYLETLKNEGLKPQKIIELVAAKDIATNKNVGKLLPKSIRKNYAASIQRGKIHYWPKQLQRNNAESVDAVLAEVADKFGFDRPILNAANALLPLHSYSDCVESLLVDGLGDAVLERYLSKEASGSILFTGGGIVPTSLLKITHLHFLHIHPGYLPSIRGADCVLWSSLLTGHTSASCFYMDPGIDEGPIVSSHWLPSLSFGLNLNGIDDRSLYRLAYGFVDPWVRAFVLRRTLRLSSNLDSLSVTPQAMEEGTTFHFMHQKLSTLALRRFFSESTSFS